MSITADTAKEHAHDPAVLCCRAEAGITIEPANLEDPAIFDDLVDSGLLLSLIHIYRCSCLRYEFHGQCRTRGK